MFNYLLTESEVFMGKSQTEMLPHYGKAKVWDALSLVARCRPVSITGE